MKKVNNLDKYLNDAQTPEQTDAQDELTAIGWKDYHVCYRNPERTSDEVGKTIWAIDKEDSELIVIKKIPTKSVKIKYSVLYSREYDCRNIPRKRRLNTQGNFVFAATEFVENRFNVLKSHRMNKNLPIEAITRIFMGFCNGLDYIHNVAEVIHRDIKPDNLRFDIEGKEKEIIPKIIDFELACRRDASLTVRGTVGYKAPEVLRKDAESVESDIYSLGICGAELLSDKQEAMPDQIRELTELDEKIIAEHEKIEKNQNLTVESKEVEKGKVNIRRYWETRSQDSEEKAEKEEFLIEIFKNATNPQPEDRYQNAAEMQQDLEIILQHKRIRNIIQAFEHAGTVSEKIKIGSTFDLDNAEKASRLKKEWLENLVTAGIDPDKSKIVAYIKDQIKEKIKPAKEAARRYLRKFNFTLDNLPVSENMEVAYANQINNSIEKMDSTVRKHILELTTCLKKLYNLCELKDPLLNIILNSSVLKREESRLQASSSYQTLLDATKSLNQTPFIMPSDSDQSEAFTITCRLKEYFKELDQRDLTAQDIKKCLEIKSILIENRHLIRVTGDKLSENLQDLLDKFDESAGKAPKDTLKQAYFSMGLDSAKEGNLDTAIAYFNKAREQSTEPDASIEYNLGCLYQVYNQSSKALQHYRAATVITKQSQGKESTRVVTNSSVIIAETGKLELASKTLLSAVQQDEVNFEARYNLGQISIETEDYPTAIEQLEAAIQMKHLPEIDNLLALAYFRTGQLEKSQAHMQTYLKYLAKKIDQVEK